MNGVSVKTIEMSFEYFLLSNNLEMLVSHESGLESGRRPKLDGPKTSKRESERSKSLNLDGPEILKK